MTAKRFNVVLLLGSALLVGGVLGPSSTVAEEKGTERSRNALPDYPNSVESMIERRRDAMERLRDAYRDAFTGRRWHQPPWIQAQRDWMEKRSDLMEERFRSQRDAMEQWSDTWGRWMHPWSQWQRDWAETRRDAADLGRLYREEGFDRAFYHRPFGPYVPWGR